ASNAVHDQLDASCQRKFAEAIDARDAVLRPDIVEDVAHGGFLAPYFDMAGLLLTLCDQSKPWKFESFPQDQIIERVAAVVEIIERNHAEVARILGCAEQRIPASIRVQIRRAVPVEDRRFLRDQTIMNPPDV